MMRSKNFLYTLLLLTTIIFALTACAGGNDSSESQETQDLVISSGEENPGEEAEEEAPDTEDVDEEDAEESEDWEGEEAGEYMDLAGTWTSEPSEDGSWVEAVIDDADDTITIRCLSDDGDTSSIYWVGTYDPPVNETDTYEWKSVKKEASDEEMSASDDTMEISYSEDALHFEIEENGNKKSVELICG